MTDIARRSDRRSRHPLSRSWVGAAALLAVLTPMLVTAGERASPGERKTGPQTIATIVLRPTTTPDAPSAAGRLVAHAVTTFDLSKLAAGAFGDQDESAR
ncbi:MAG: hypothetical protein AB1749_02210 [Pseudomonadota bacterium]